MDKTLEATGLWTSLWIPTFKKNDPPVDQSPLQFGLSKKLLQVQLRSILENETTKRLFEKIKNYLSWYSKNIIEEEFDLLVVMSYLYITWEFDKEDLPNIPNLKIETEILKQKYEKWILQADTFENSEMEAVSDFIFEQVKKYLSRNTLSYEMLENKFDQISHSNPEIIYKLFLEFSIDNDQTDFIFKIFIWRVYMLVFEWLKLNYITNDHWFRAKILELQTKAVKGIIGDWASNWKYGFQSDEFNPLNWLESKEWDLRDRIRDMIENDKEMFRGITWQIYLKRILWRTGLLRIKEVVESLWWFDEFRYCSYIQSIRLEHMFKIRDWLAQKMLDGELDKYRWEEWFEKFRRENKIKPVSKINLENLKDIYFKILADVARQTREKLIQHWKVEYIPKRRRTPEVEIVSINQFSIPDVKKPVPASKHEVVPDSKRSFPLESLRVTRNEIKDQMVREILDNFEGINSFHYTDWYLEAEVLKVRIFDDIDISKIDDGIPYEPDEWDKPRDELADRIPPEEYVNLNIAQVRRSVTENLYLFVNERLNLSVKDSKSISISEAGNLIEFLNILRSNDEISLFGKIFKTDELLECFMIDLKWEKGKKSVNQNIMFTYNRLKQSFIEELIAYYYTKDDIVWQVNYLGWLLYKMDNFYYLPDPDSEIDYMPYSMPLIQNINPKDVRVRKIDANISDKALKEYDRLWFSDKATENYNQVYEEVENIDNWYFRLYYRFLYDLVWKCECNLSQCMSFYLNVYIEIWTNLKTQIKIKNKRDIDFIMNRIRSILGFIKFLINITGWIYWDRIWFFIQENPEKQISNKIVTTLNSNFKVFERSIEDINLDIIPSFQKRGKKLTKKLKLLLENIEDMKSIIEQFEDWVKLLENVTFLKDRLFKLGM